MNKKIVSIDDLSRISRLGKSKGKKVVHCHGVFDLLHIGHIKHFQEAKALGDLLIVTITPDKYVKKGPNRPAFTTILRLEAIAALESVDFVAENKWPTAVESILLIKPSIYFKGPDYKDSDSDITGMIKEEAKAISSVKGKIKYSTDITFSSSSLLNKYGDIYTDDQKVFISSIENQLKEGNLKKALYKLKNLKVLLIGETILDQYVFTDALGKSGKEPVLAFRELNSEQYVGGAAAVANHLSSFCKNITLLSALGEKGEHESYFKKNLAKNVNAEFIYKSDSPTILKKRFIDVVTNNKTLGVYSINDESLQKTDERKFIQIIKKKIKRHDLVLITDYGHGLISESSADQISKLSPYTALNVQMNSANSGNHSFTKYKKADCVIINEGELRHELRSREGDLEILMRDLSKKLKATNIVVTRGSNGATLYNKKKRQFYSCPAFATRVIDKVGSGDAMLALLSISLRAGYDERFSLFLGSLAAAQSVESIGNSKSINMYEIVKTIQHAIK